MAGTVASPEQLENLIQEMPREIPLSGGVENTANSTAYSSLCSEQQVLTKGIIQDLFIRAGTSDNENGGVGRIEKRNSCLAQVIINP